MRVLCARVGFQHSRQLGIRSHDASWLFHYNLPVMRPAAWGAPGLAFSRPGIPHRVKLGIFLEVGEALIASSSRHLLFGGKFRGKFGGHAGLSTLRHLLGKFAHRFLRNRAPTFPLLPQRKSFLNRVFLASQPPAVNRLPDKRSLVRSKMHVHMPQRRSEKRTYQAHLLPIFHHKFAVCLITDRLTTPVQE